MSPVPHWERGDRWPQGPALLQLNLIDRDSTGVLRPLARMEPGDMPKAPGRSVARLLGLELW